MSPARRSPIFVAFRLAAAANSLSKGCYTLYFMDL